MDVLERLAAVLLVVLFFILVPAGMSSRDCGNNLELCAAESVDDLLSAISANRTLSEEQIYMLSTLLYNCGYQYGFEMTEYYYETGIDGNQYQYTVSFDEISKHILENGLYEFKKGSFLYVCVAGYSPRNLMERILYSRRTIEKSIRVQ